MSDVFIPVFSFKLFLNQVLDPEINGNGKTMNSDYAKIAKARITGAKFWKRATRASWQEEPQSFKVPLDVGNGEKTLSYDEPVQRSR